MIPRGFLRGLAILGTLVVATAAYVALRPVPRLAGSAGSDALRGVFHVHSDSSHDGRRSAAETLAGAADLGLDFVVFTEHNRNLRHATSSNGPVVVPGTELSTNFGHLIYLGLEYVPPRGVERSTIGVPDSLAARGAMTIPAHPSSPRRPWLGRVAGVGGIEIASTSTAARVKADPFIGIIPAFLAFAVNRRLGLAQLYYRDDGTLATWDRLRHSPVAGMCGTDSHGYLEPEWELRTWILVLDPWPGAPEPLTSGAIVERLRAGRFACVAGLLTDGAPAFAFRALTADGAVTQGGVALASQVSALEVEGPRTDDGNPVPLVLFRDGEEVARTDEGRLRYPDPGPGVWRVEARLGVPRVLVGSREVPVLYSNRILVRPDSLGSVASASPRD